MKGNAMIYMPTNPTPSDLAYFGAVEALLWTECVDSSDGDDSNFLDHNYETADIALADRSTLRHLIDMFLEDNKDSISEFLEVTGLNYSQIGHDLILTANGHGAGYWDRGAGEAGERLTEASGALGSINLELGDDDQIHIIGIA